MGTLADHCSQTHINIYMAGRVPMSPSLLHIYGRCLPFWSSHVWLHTVPDQYKVSDLPRCSQRSGYVALLHPLSFIKNGPDWLFLAGSDLGWVIGRWGMLPCASLSGCVCVCVCMCVRQYADELLLLTALCCNNTWDRPTAEAASHF